MFFKILLHLPAQVVHDVMKHVFKKRYGQLLSIWVRVPVARRRHRGPSGAAMADIDDVGEPNTGVSINPYILHCCKSSAKKRQKRSLPQEMFFKILLHLPALVVHNVMKHVCREWSLMIHTKDFIQHHLLNSTCGILIQDECPTRGDNRMDFQRFRDVIYVEMRGGRLEICKFDSGFEFLVWTSCNGLVVVRGRDEDNYYVTNPLTKQRAILPPSSSKIGSYENFGLAFVEASMEYKVVDACGNEPHNRVTRILVLTIGVDRVWRPIDIGVSSLTHRWMAPVVTGGYVHWICNAVVLTLNVESETISLFPMPQSSRLCGRFLPMGSNLSFLCKTSDCTRDVWEMNSETGEWTMNLSLDLEPLRCNFRNLCSKKAKPIVPFGWLVIREVLLFSTGGSQTDCVAYNVKTREIQSFELGTSFKIFRFQPHVNSLVWLEG